VRDRMRSVLNSPEIPARFDRLPRRRTHFRAISCLGDPLRATFMPSPVIYPGSVPKRSAPSTIVAVTSTPEVARS
jgi:hypothetical protein